MMFMENEEGIASLNSSVILLQWISLKISMLIAIMRSAERLHWRCIFWTSTLPAISRKARTLSLSLSLLFVHEEHVFNSMIIFMIYLHFNCSLLDNLCAARAFIIAIFIGISIFFNLNRDFRENVLFFTSNNILFIQCKFQLDLHVRKNIIFINIIFYEPICLLQGKLRSAISIC